MNLKDYFEDAKGLGVFATADSEGKVDVAVYSRPHVMDSETVAFIMRDRLTHHNLQSNPHGAYLFAEAGKKYVGKRLFLTKIREEQDTELVLILSGDHVYKMDYADMIEFHRKNQADATIAVTRLPKDELLQFGTVTTDENQQVTGFQEKVKEPKSDLVSMGVYVFEKELLHRILEEDAQKRSSKHDFGRNIFPQLVGNCRLFAYNFEGKRFDCGDKAGFQMANLAFSLERPELKEELMAFMKELAC